MTVVVPVLNGAHVLPATLPAVLAQPADRIVYVDDGSTDETGAILREAASRDVRVEVVAFPSNRGRAAARNAGAERASGDALVFLDADVVPGAGLAAMLAGALELPGAVAAVGALRYDSADPDDPYHRYLTSSRRGARGGGRVPWKHFLSTASAVRRSAFEAAGGFPEGVRYGEDLALACRLAGPHPFGLWREARARAQLLDLGDLGTALAKLEAFGEALAEARRACPDVLRVAGLDRLESDRWVDRAALALVRAERPASLARGVLSRLPAGVQPLAVRYLLAHTLARSARLA